jgi:large subunit ribosomal protein L15
MNELSKLTKPRGATKRKTRVGRGQASGLGKTAGRGGKGQKARTGNMHFEGFEGGQSPLQRRLPKFGFNSPNRVEYAVVNVGDLVSFAAGSTVDVAALRAKGLVKGTHFDGVKVLGVGSLSTRLVVKANKFSGKAREAIEKAGGSVEEIPLKVHKPESAVKAHAGKGVKAPRS